MKKNILTGENESKVWLALGRPVIISAHVQHHMSMFGGMTNIENINSIIQNINKY